MVLYPFFTKRNINKYMNKAQTITFAEIFNDRNTDVTQIVLVTK